MGYPWLLTFHALYAYNVGIWLYSCLRLSDGLRFFVFGEIDTKLLCERGFTGLYPIFSGFFFDGFHFFEQ